MAAAPLGLVTLAPQQKTKLAVKSNSENVKLGGQGVMAAMLVISLNSLTLVCMLYIQHPNAPSQSCTISGNWKQNPCYQLLSFFIFFWHARELTDVSPHHPAPGYSSRADSLLPFHPLMSTERSAEFTLLNSPFFFFEMPLHRQKREGPESGLSVITWLSSWRWALCIVV